MAVFIAVYSYNHFFTNGMLLGKYVNRNYGDDFIGYIPHIADTLLLKENNQFESPYYGKGAYKLIYDLVGTRKNKQNIIPDSYYFLFILPDDDFPSEIIFSRCCIPHFVIAPTTSSSV